MDPLILAVAATVAVTTVLIIIGLFARYDNLPINRLLAMKRGSTPQRAPLHSETPLLGRPLSVIPLLDLVFARSRRVSQLALDLDRAGLQIRVSEFLAGRAILATLFFMLALVIAGASLAGLIFSAFLSFVGYLLPPLYLGFRQTRRLGQLEQQLPEALTIMSNALKAGFGLLQSIDAAAQQMSPPMSVELNRLLREANLGASVEDALKALGERVRSPDLDLVVTAMLIQREVGGNLAEVLDNVARTIRERNQIMGEIKTLTTTQRWEGYVAGLVPVGLAGILFLVNQDYMMTLVTEPTGRILLAVAATWQFIGFLVMRRIVAIEV